MNYRFSNQSPATLTFYRPEIDGLRAIAVLAVIFNHINANLIPSGFLGVDIFFVISGFVITASLTRNNTNSFVDFLRSFYSRRIKRILPPLLVMVVVTLLLISFFNPRPDEYIRTGLFSLFGLSNIYLIKISSNYFAPAAQLNPFLHTWSLGVEEQFYLAYPLIFWIATHASPFKNRKYSLFKLMTFLSIASLILFFCSWFYDPITSYFSVLTRFWEMSFGTLAFSISTSFSVEKYLLRKQYLSNVILFLLFALFFLPKDYLPLGVVFSALFTAIFLISNHGSSWSHKVLSFKSFVFIGLISYSLYLWHWPLIVIAAWTVGLNKLTVPFILILVFVLAYMSWFFVENPFKSSALPKPTLLSSPYTPLGILFTTVGISIFAYVYDWKNLYTGRVIARNKIADKQLNREQLCTTAFDDFVPDDISNCFSPKSKKIFTALIGDSIAKSIYPLIELDYSDLSPSTFYIARTACFFPQPLSSKGNCRRWSDNVYSEIVRLASHHEKSIITIVAYYQSYFEPSRAVFQPFLGTSNDLNGYLNAISTLAEDLRRYDSDLVILAPFPVHSFNPYPECHAEWFRPFLASKCFDGTPRQDAKLNVQSFGSKLKNLSMLHENMTVLDFTEVLCSYEYCKIRGPGDTFLYLDSHHLSRAGSEYISTIYLRQWIQLSKQ